VCQVCVEKLKEYKGRTLWGARIGESGQVELLLATVPSMETEEYIQLGVCPNVQHHGGVMFKKIGFPNV